MNYLRVAVLGLLAGGAVCAHAADRWTEFQGALTSGAVSSDLPLHWSSDQNKLWEVPLTGYGQSSPVVWDRQIYVTSISGAMKEQCHVTAFDLKTGKECWKRDIESASQAQSTNYVSKAAPTPVLDEAGVIAMFEGGSLIALTHQGEIRWERNLVADYGAIESRHGLAASLAQDDRHVFVWIERQESPYVMAVAKSDGKTQWKEAGLGVTSWASPRLMTVEGSPQLILSGSGAIAGLDPKDGKRLWTFNDISGNSTPTPLPIGDDRFLIGASVGRGESGGSNAAASNGVVRVAKDESGKYQASWVWRAEKATSSFGSPIADGKFAYFVNRSGVVFCLDLETGKEQYAKRTANSIWATPIAIGDRIYFFGKDGATSVVKPGPNFDLLAENQLWQSSAAPEGEAESSGPSFGGPVLYAAAVADNRLVLRRGDVLYCIGN